MPRALGGGPRAGRPAGLAAALAERNRQLEAEEEALARLAVRRERTRIARELHDIVAHNLAVIVVQAGAGRMAERWEPAVAAERLAAIRESGHQVLLEMSRLTDVLGAERGDDPDARLRALLDGARAAGLTVRAEPWPPLPHTLAETALRVVQEAVTNAIKHAPGARLDVGLALRDDSLRIEVRDTGAEAASDLAATGSGSGLDGMRARVGAHGGRLDAGPDAAGRLARGGRAAGARHPTGVGEDAPTGRRPRSPPGG